MTLDEMLAGVDSVVVANVKSFFEKETGERDSKISKKDSELSRRLGQLNKQKDLLRELDLDPESESLAEQVANLKAKTVSMSGTDTEISKMKSDLAKLQKIADDATAETNTTRRNLAQTKAVEMLSGKILNHEDAAFRLVSEGKIKFSTATKEIVFVDGEDEKDLSTGIAEYVKARPSVAINSQNAGGGSSSSHSTKPQGAKTISMSEFDKLSQRDKSAKIAEGYLPVE